MDLLTLAIILFLVGVVLGIAEIFIPSGGVLVVLSIGSFVGSIVCAFKVSAVLGLAVLVLAPVVMLVLVIKGFKILPRTWVGRRMILSANPDEQSEADSDYSSTASSGPGDGADLCGQEGVARTELRPSGSALIGGRRYNVVSAGEFIMKGAKIRVIEVRGNRVVVEVVEEVR